MEAPTPTSLMGHRPSFVEQDEQRRLWHTFTRNEAIGKWPPDIFGQSDVKIANDGGIGDVHKLLYPMQYISALSLAVFCVGNVTALFYTDLSALGVKMAVIAQGAAGPEQKQQVLFTHMVLAHILGKELMPLVEQHVTLSLPLLELALTSILLLRILRFALCAIFAGTFFNVRSYEFKRWWFTVTLFWDFIPQLASFSAMRMLYHVTPSVFMAEAYVGSYLLYNRVTYAESWKDRLCAFFPMLWFIISRTVAFMIGFDAFLVKLSMSQDNWTGALYLLFQTLNVVNIHWFVRERLFIFMFAGEEGNLEDKEAARIEVFNCLLARQIYRDHGWFKGTIIMLAFDDYDFQMLALDPAKEEGTTD